MSKVINKKLFINNCLRFMCVWLSTTQNSGFDSVTGPFLPTRIGQF